MASSWDAEGVRVGMQTAKSSATSEASTIQLEDVGNLQKHSTKPKRRLQILQLFWKTKKDGSHQHSQLFSGKMRTLTTIIILGLDLLTPGRAFASTSATDLVQPILSTVTMVEKLESLVAGQHIGETSTPTDDNRQGVESIHSSQSYVRTATPSFALTGAQPSSNIETGRKLWKVGPEVNASMVQDTSSSLAHTTNLSASATMSIFTGMGSPQYLNIQRVLMILIAVVPLFVLIIV
ncbi:hypothetical protein ACLMJK_001369 [Lecanora helva]